MNRAFIIACLALTGCTSIGPTIQTTCGAIPVTAHIDQWVPCGDAAGCYKMVDGERHIWYRSDSKDSKRHECGHVNSMMHTAWDRNNCARVTSEYWPYHLGATICFDEFGNEYLGANHK